MGERYFVTGVQLGMIKAFLQFKKLEEIEKVLTEIEDKQFMGNT